MKAAHPEARPIAGGTDLMVELNFDRVRPDTVIDVWRLLELSGWERDDGRVFLGAGVTYARIMRELSDQTVLVEASRTVGSPQIRNRGTVGGNLGTSSPAGDALPPLAVYQAEVVLASAAGGERRLPWDEFMVGPKRNTLRPDELILGAEWRVPRGPGSFSKVGTRNAMVISIAGLALQVDEESRSIRVALGAAAPVIVRAREAEEFGAAAFDEAGAWDDPSRPLPEGDVAHFGELVGRAPSPIDDVRGTAAYRRRACSVVGSRALAWAIAARSNGGSS